MFRRKPLLSAIAPFVFSVFAVASEKDNVKTPATVIYKDELLQLKMAQMGKCTPSHSRILLRIENIGKETFTVFRLNGFPELDLAVTDRHGHRYPYTPAGHARFVDRDAENRGDPNDEDLRFESKEFKLSIASEKKESRPVARR